MGHPVNGGSALAITHVNSVNPTIIVQVMERKLDGGEEVYNPRKRKVFQCDAYLAKPTVISNENKKYTRITQTR